MILDRIGPHAIGRIGRALDDDLGPWQTIAGDSVGVIAMRLTLMPWLMVLEPAAARREADMTVDKKKAAFAETQLALWSVW